MFVFIHTVSVSLTPMYIQTKTNVSQHFPFSVSHSENTPRHMRLKDALARCCLHFLRLTQSEVAK